MFQTQKYHSARSQYSFFISFWFSGRLKKPYTFLTQSRKSAKISARSLCSLITINGFFSSFWNVSGRYKSSWIRPYNECYEQKDTLYRQTMWFINKILRRIACFRHTHTKMACSQSCIAFSQVSGFLVGIKKHAKVQKFRLARSARSQPLMGFSRVFGRYKSSWTRPYNECYEHKDTLYRQTMRFTNTILRRIACSRHTQKNGLLANRHHFIAFSRVSGRYVKHFSDAKVQIFWLALSARSILFFSSFLFLMNKTISRVLRTQSWTYCTDKQWLISILLRFEKNRMFSTQI